MILCIGTTPAVQRVMVFRALTMDAVNRASTTVDGIAGKSVNVAKVLKTLGEQPFAIGFAGGDRGEFLLRRLSERGIESQFIKVEAPTRQCTTVIDQAAKTHTELVEESQPVSAADYARLITIIQEKITTSRAVIMSGSIAPGVPSDLYLRCTRLACETRALAVVDAQGIPLFEALNAKPDLVKPNRAELAATVKSELNNDDSTMDAMRQLHQRGAQRVVVTAGKDPALAFDGKTLWRVTSPSVETRNPIGSGDAFTAGLVSHLLKGDDLGEACRWGAAAGAANALTLMAGEVEMSDVQRLAPSVAIEKVS